MVDKTFFFFFNVDIPCMKCEKSCRILKIIYHGIISTDGAKGNTCIAPERKPRAQAQTSV